MIEKRIRADPIARFLIEKCSLTRVQLDTYLIDRYGRREGIDLRERIKLREGGMVKKGAFLRTLKQARINFEESFFTVILSEYFGLLEKGASVRLLEIGDLIASAEKEGISEEKGKRITEVLIHIVKSLQE